MKNYRVIITDLGFNGWCDLDDLRDMFSKGVYTDLDGPHGERRKVTVNGEVVDKDAMQMLIDATEPSTTEHGQARLYPPIGEQLDMIFKEVKESGSISADGMWASTIQAVKDSMTEDKVADWPAIEEISEPDPADNPAEPVYISEEELELNPL